MPYGLCDMIIMAAGNKIFGVAGWRTNEANGKTYNDKTFCYSINENSWAILP